MWVIHAFFAGKKAGEVYASKSGPGTLKEVRQQYPDGFLAPESDSAHHLGRLEEEHRGHREPERLGGLEVEDQLELEGLLHGEVSGLRAFQNTQRHSGPIIQPPRGPVGMP
jgi:hypothetical protein